MSERTTEVVPVKLAGGTEFLMEVSTVRSEREQVSGLDNLNVNDLSKSITAISATFVEALKSVSPDKFTVEFGIEASVKSGKLLALLCNGEGKANLKISLEWSKKAAT